MNYSPIGIFDSGYGGLTVLKEIKALLPNYDYLYLGDNLRAPYGTRSFSTVYEYTLQSVKWFFDQGCELVILACNTASAKALRSIQQNDLPKIDSSKRVLGVIRPTAEVIGEYTNTNHVGILGTQGTVQSESYILEIAKFFPNVFVSQEACPTWVNIVEENKIDMPETNDVVKHHIDSLMDKDSDIDTFLLACTHYPLLEKKIKQFTPSKVKIVSQGKIVAESLKSYLQFHTEIEEKCSKNSMLKFCTTGSTEDFNNHSTIFFGQLVESEKIYL